MCVIQSPLSDAAFHSSVVGRSAESISYTAAYLATPSTSPDSTR